MRAPALLAVVALAAAQPAPPASAPPASAPPAPAPPAPPAPAPAAPGFEAYLQTVRAKAQARGIAPATLDRELSALTPNDRVIQLDRAQPDDSARVRPSFRAYREARVTTAQADRGRARLDRLAPALGRIEARYGVPAPVLLAIWGAETNYGSYTGDFDLVRSLATLAWEGRRRALFEGELLAALELIDRGRVSRDRLVGSWAGATGQPQFLPTSYGRHAADGDGDGRADIWGSEADTLASIASYLRASGWQAGGRWGHPVYVPPNLERWRVRSITPARSCTRPLNAHSRWISVDEWRRLGLVPLGAPWPAGSTLATLVEPDGEGQGAYLAYGNYRALLGYNCSNFYALSVGLLADRIAEGGAAAAAAGGAGGLR